MVERSGEIVQHDVRKPGDQQERKDGKGFRGYPYWSDMVIPGREVSANTRAYDKNDRRLNWRRSGLRLGRGTFAVNSHTWRRCQ